MRFSHFPFHIAGAGQSWREELYVCGGGGGGGRRGGEVGEVGGLN